MRISGNEAAWGLIPFFLSPFNPKPLWEQIHDQYRHGGGWRDFDGFTVSVNEDGQYSIEYAGDPPMHEIGRITYGNELILLFDHSWLLWTDTESGEEKVARVD